MILETFSFLLYAVAVYSIQHYTHYTINLWVVINDFEWWHLCFWNKFERSIQTLAIRISTKGFFVISWMNWSWISVCWLRFNERLFSWKNCLQVFLWMKCKRNIFFLLNILCRFQISFICIYLVNFILIWSCSIVLWRWEKYIVFLSG